MIYLNHAATTYPKPAEVQKAVMEALASPPASQYRSVAAENGLQESSAFHTDHRKLCRNHLAQLFQITDPERIYFGSGSTQALNQAILGFQGFTARRRGIVITATEHNAVLRTIYDGLQEPLKTGRIQLTVVPCDSDGYVDLEKMKHALTEETALVIVNHSSNVTGAVQDMEAIGRMVHDMGACFLVDASQSAGSIPIDAERMHIDLLAFTAHKGLYGIQGCGGLYIRNGITLRPICYGGTGTDSEILIPDDPFYEVGTANLPGIAALNAGVEYVLRNGIETIQKQETERMEQLYSGLKQCPGVRVIGSCRPGGCALSFTVDGLSPSDVGYILSGTYQIIVRTGLHCAPLIHSYLGTERGGTVRVSISYLTTAEEIDALLSAVRELTQALTGGQK